MNWEVWNLQDRFTYLSSAFLRHVLTTSDEFTTTAEHIVSLANKAQEAADAAILEVLGTKPIKTVAAVSDHSWRTRNFPQRLYYHGTKSTGNRDRFYLSLSIDTTNEAGCLKFNSSDDVWNIYLPTWTDNLHTLEFINSAVTDCIPTEFVNGFDDQANNLRLALRDLNSFLKAAQDADIKAEHLLYMCPTLRILFNYRQTESFKRRPRKIKSVPPPSILLKQQLAILASAKTILEE